MKEELDKRLMMMDYSILMMSWLVVLMVDTTLSVDIQD